MLLKVVSHYGLTLEISVMDFGERKTLDRSVGGVSSIQFFVLTLQNPLVIINGIQECYAMY